MLILHYSPSDTQTPGQSPKHICQYRAIHRLEDSFSLKLFCEVAHIRHMVGADEKHVDVWSPLIDA